MTRRSPPRIFWLGMHKVLVETEFKLLQRMGYAVLRPPYRSRIVDQSVSTSDDFGNIELAPDVRRTLMACDFFDGAIPDAVAALLAEHFDAVVVTINPDWLKAALQAFAGTIVYRCYGQLRPLSAALAYNGAAALIRNRDNVHFVPHAPECLDDEEPWLAALATVVPYWLTDDVLALRGSWHGGGAGGTRSMALMCPNIANPYYGAHFRYLKRHFEERCYRYYGVQTEPNADFNLVGTLPRDEQLRRLAAECGFLYTFRERNVCYLPPVEMMLLGGPVLFFPGSLLARYAGDGAPGCVADEAAAALQSRRLLGGDAGLVREIVAAQQTVAARYTPDVGMPAFRRTFERILPLAPERPSAAAQWVAAHAGGRVLVVAPGPALPAWADGAAVVHALRQWACVLTGLGVGVSVAHAGGDRNAVLRDWRAGCPRPERIDAVDLAEVSRLDARALRQRYAYAVVGEDAAMLPLPLLAYVPGHVPHFLRGRGWFDDAAAQAAVDRSRSLVQAACRVVTASAFWADHLPSTGLGVARDRIEVVAFGPGSAVARETADVPAVLVSEPFVLQPTHAAPQQRVDLLVMAWLLLNQERAARPVHLVLTVAALPRRLVDLVVASRLDGCVHLLPDAAGATLAWLVAHARCTALTTEIDAQLSLPLLDALRLDCPVVCHDEPLLMSELGVLARFLQVVPFGDIAAFASHLAGCVDHRDRALLRQRLVRQQILDRCGGAPVEAAVAALHRLLLDDRTADDERQTTGHPRDAVTHGGEFAR